MGAWGHGAFDNDTACDWAAGIDHVNDLSMIERAIHRVHNVGDEYLEADPASEALAACEVLARLRGRWGVRNPYTARVDKWVEANLVMPPAPLLKRARQAIDRVMTAPSELLELWCEGKDGKEWKAGLLELRGRLG